MQAIHIAGYLTINDCDNIYNKMTSYINYSHVSFQPMFFLIGYLGLMQFTGNINNESRIRMNFALYITFSLGVFLFIRMFNMPEIVKSDSKEPTLRSKETQTKKNSGCIKCDKTSI